jgi:hypothetical protein
MTMNYHFARWCRSIRGYSPRSYFGPVHGLNDRTVQDLEQGRSLPSRSLVVLLKAIEIDSDFMRYVAKEAKEDLEMLDQARANRN